MQNKKLKIIHSLLGWLSYLIIAILIIHTVLVAPQYFYPIGSDQGFINLEDHDLASTVDIAFSLFFLSIFLTIVILRYFLKKLQNYKK